MSKTALRHNYLLLLFVFTAFAAMAVAAYLSIFPALILFVFGLGIFLSLCFILLRLSSAKQRADEESKSKSTFLANMSHEIRTPMNAITGMAELLLRGELSDEARGYALDIKQAGNNLLSIINDILDISKIEAGKLEINQAKYMLSSLVNDTANIICIRLTEKPIRFFTNIDENIPNNLIGDEVRLRQILLNLLSNAVKYSEEGEIGLHISRQKRENGRIWLKITVTDTGKGIKPEDRSKMFGDFIQFDTRKNQGIEGAGLGLAITKRLCLAMGGSISAESEYGKGSVFTVIIPQGIESEIPLAIHSIANIENGKADINSYIENFETSGINCFTLKGARLLVVDDIPTNLKVAEGLLAPYLAEIDTCTRGAEAVELVKRRNYDIVFMDHMMPEMDGIETTAAIRAWEKSVNGEQVPIIALTANAIVGMKEMFLEKGFNDFLAKPVEIIKLDEILDKWVPKDKKGSRNQEESHSSLPIPHSSFINIPGVDVKQGLAVSGGRKELYRKVLSLFRKNAEERLPFLQKPPEIDELDNFVIIVHALKSASASIGAAGVSACAAEIEAAGTAFDLSRIREKLPAFAKQISELTEGIRVWENTPGS